MTAQRLSVSIIIEWSNVLQADLDQSRRMMSQLVAQARDLNQGFVKETLAVAFPLQTLICFDSQRVATPAIQQVINEFIDGGPTNLDVDLYSCPGAEYYDLKNLGANKAHGEVLLFIDSDVVPEPGWLKSMLSAFANPDLLVVAGCTYIEPRDIYHKAFALNWVFPLRPDWSGMRTCETFWANNVGFRSKTFRRFLYPPMSGASRGSCAELAGQLLENGISIFENGSACIRHPAPKCLDGFARRALAQGRDRVLWHRQFGTWWTRSIPAALLRFCRHLASLAPRTLGRFRKVGVKPFELPIVLMISATYYSLFFLGELLTHIVPTTMQRHFRV